MNSTQTLCQSFHHVGGWGQQSGHVFLVTQQTVPTTFYLYLVLHIYLKIRRLSSGPSWPGLTLWPGVGPWMC